jgi:hypothetical protein
MPRLGVLGTLVLDTIHLPPTTGGRTPAPLSDWGGIAYSLCALEASAPRGWEILPILKVGEDLRREADEFLSELTRIRSLEGVVTVPEANNRVELYYQSGPRRCEKLTGGVPGWGWSELAPLADSCDALIVNFIAGWEMDLPVAQRLRDAHAGPIYADVHSLLLAVGADGVRILRPLPEWPAWRECFDQVQMNEEELAALTPAGSDPVTTARESVAGGPRVLFVTRGDRGASWWSRDSDAGGGVRTGHEPSDPVPGELADPTGCGDVWGAACAAALLEGEDPAGAARRANLLAGAAARHRGTSGLAGTLRGLIQAIGEREPA